MRRRNVGISLVLVGVVVGVGVVRVVVRLGLVRIVVGVVLVRVYHGVVHSLLRLLNCHSLPDCSELAEGPNRETNPKSVKAP